MNNKKTKKENCHLNSAIKMLVALFILAAAIFPSIYEVYANSQTFPVVFRLTPSNELGLNIDLIEPDGLFYNKDSAIIFRMVVRYDKNLILNCNLSIDNSFVQGFTILDGNEVQYTNSISLNHGQHSWNLKCRDSSGNERTSSTKTFVVDLDLPSVRISDLSPNLTLTNTINLTFTPIDSFGISRCDLYVFRIDTNTLYYQQTFTAPSVVSGKDTSKQINVDHGNYSWNVTCYDNAGNKNTSITKRFTADLKTEFTVTTNKANYDLGEGGLIIITAPYGAKVKVLITNPKSSTITKDFTGPYPVLQYIDWNNYAGNYKIESFMSYNDALKSLTSTYSVQNNIDARIHTSSEVYQKDVDINFRATSSGGIGDKSYIWDFGDGTAIVSGNNITRKYDKYGTYDVQLKVEDSFGNSRIVTKVIKIKEKFTVKFIILDADTKEPVQSATINFNGEIKRTDEKGEAVFSEFEGKYPLIVYSDLYESYFEKLFSNNQNQQKTIYLKKTQGKADNFLSDIGLILNETKNNTDKLDQKNITLKKKTQNTTLDNSNYIEIGNENDFKSDVDDREIKLLIEDAIEEIELLNAEERQAANILNILSGLEKAKKEVSQAERDLYNLNENRKKLPQSEIEQEKKKVNDRIANLKATTIRTLKILESNDFIKYPSKEEISDLTKEHISSSKTSMNKKAESSLISDNYDIQKAITVFTKVRVLEIKYLSGKTEEITLIVHEITTMEDLSKRYFLVKIPKEIAKKSDDIVMLSAGKVINPDPVFSYQVNSEKKIAYYIKSKINSEKAKSIMFGMLYDPKQIREVKSKSTLTGFAIFSKVNNIENPILMIQVIAIIILVFVFIYYQFELDEIIKKGILLNDRELNEIIRLIKDAKVCLDNNELDNAEIVYEDIMKEYKKLNPKLKAKIIDETKEVYYRIVRTKIIDYLNLISQYIQNNEIEKAKKSYEKIKDLYSELPKKHKAMVSERCSMVFKKLAEV